jgi:hypothetical protein
LTNADNLKATVRVNVGSGGIVVSDFLQDDITAAEWLHVAFLLETAQKGVVVGEVVSEYSTTILNRGQLCYRIGSLSGASACFHAAQTIS